MQGYITGLGKPATAMVLLILYYIIIRIPAAYYLCNIAGLTGIWIAFLVSHVTAFVIAGFMTVKLSREKRSSVNQLKIKLS
jgi:Na+-driven multidrug efflux pump